MNTMVAQDESKDETKDEVRTYKMYIVINAELGMGKGKMCGQCGHAVADWTRRLEKDSTQAYKLWCANCEPKIVLKAAEATLRELRSKYPLLTNEIHDAGKTQIAAGSLTAVAFQPIDGASAAAAELQQLKLL
jgi:peptidyl-tRNA hydrolase